MEKFAWIIKKLLWIAVRAYWGNYQHCQNEWSEACQGCKHYDICKNESEIKENCQ